MVGAVPQATPLQKHRFEVIKEYGGCVPCLLMGHTDVHATIEHVTESGRRIGKGNEQHDHTVGLCGYHHFGHCWPGITRHRMTEMVGPSLAYGRKSFEEHFGPEETLVQLQDLIVHTYDETPWESYTMPAHVVAEVRELWIEQNREEQA